MPTEKREIRVTYTAIDGCRKVRNCRSLVRAQLFAQTYVGTYPELGTDYAVSGDGVGKITVAGATLAELFPELAQPERVGASFDFGEDWDDFSPETLARRAAARQARLDRLAEERANPWVVLAERADFYQVTDGRLGSTWSVVSRHGTEEAAMVAKEQHGAENTDEDVFYHVRLEIWEGAEFVGGPRPRYEKGPLALAEEAEWHRAWDAKLAEMRELFSTVGSLSDDQT